MTTTFLFVNFGLYGLDIVKTRDSRRRSAADLAPAVSATKYTYGRNFNKIAFGSCKYKKSVD